MCIEEYHQKSFDCYDLLLLLFKYLHKVVFGFPLGPQTMEYLVLHHPCSVEYGFHLTGWTLHQISYHLMIPTSIVPPSQPMLHAVLQCRTKDLWLDLHFSFGSIQGTSLNPYRHQFDISKVSGLCKTLSSAMLLSLCGEHTIVLSTAWVI